MISSLIIGFDDQSNDEALMVVGTKRKGNGVEVINAISGDEAVELYKRLTTIKGSEEGGKE